MNTGNWGVLRWKRAYLALMVEWCNKCGVEIWSWCLMPNYVHLIAVPSGENALGRAIGEAHRRYTRRINFREGWHGHLWQERFASFPMDKTYLFAAARYVEMIPVAAGLVQSPADYPWSSARSRLTEATDPLVTTSTLVDMVGDWRHFGNGRRRDRQELPTAREKRSAPWRERVSRTDGSRFGATAQSVKTWNEAEIRIIL